MTMHMHLLVAITRHTGKRLAEIAFLLILIAGVWIVATGFPQLKIRAARMIVPGVLLALSGLLLIIATHWDGFG